MKDSEALRELVSLVERSRLLRPGGDGVVMLSGGADSACLAAAAVMICGPQAVAAVHVNYGLRPDADRGEEAARRLCGMLRIDLHVERPDLGEGNLQARAREARYAAAEQLRSRLGVGWVATGHTRTDLVETLLYRFAVSPGARALRTMEPAGGGIIRPLHELERTRTRSLARACGLPFADDPTNAEDRFARNRIRAEVLPVLREIGPELERNVALTHAELREEGELLERLAADALERAGVGEGRPIARDELERLDPALRRLVLRRMAERVAGRRIALGRPDMERIERGAEAEEGRVIEMGRGLRAVCEAGTVRFTVGEAPVPAAASLAIPGVASFGDWELRAELSDRPPDPLGPELAVLDPTRVGERLEVRSWRDGDRMRPLGLGGSKTLADIFGELKVPRSLRRRLPVVAAADGIAWVAGVAVSEPHRYRADAHRTDGPRAVVLHAVAAPEARAASGQASE